MESSPFKVGDLIKYQRDNGALFLVLKTMPARNSAEKAVVSQRILVLDFILGNKWEFPIYKNDQMFCLEEFER
jgi:hypothetical protein